jgi:hypothetical protein
MCYLITPDSTTDKSRRVTRSIVLPRHPDENAPHELDKRPSDYFFPTPLRTPLAPLAGRKRTAPGAAPTETRETPPTAETVEDEEEEEFDNMEIEPRPDSDSTPGGDPRGPGPEEQKLRADYLQMAEDERERYMELTTPPPNVLDHGDIIRITRHRCGTRGDSSTYSFNVEMSMGKDLANVCLADMKVDCPAMLAKYILDNKSLSKVKDLVSWARPMVKTYDNIVKIAKRMERRYGITLITLKDKPEIPKSHAMRIKCRRRTLSVSKPPVRKSGSPNKRKSNDMGKFKYGIYVPKNVEDALRQDRTNNNNLWRNSIIAELGVIQQYGTFKVVPKKLEQQVLKTHQYAPLRIIFTVKEDLRRKSRLIIGGHVIDSENLDTYSSNMRGISARILMLIASANKLDVLTGDIKAAYLNATSDLDVVAKLGKEFTILDPNYKTGSLATVEKALYGLSTSAKRWREALTNTIRSMGFDSSRDDADVWFRQTSYGFEYIGTHTDDILAVSQDAQAIMEELKQHYDLSKVEEPRFHLGCDYMKDPDDVWCYGTKTHVAESIKKVEAILGSQLGLEGTPMSDTCKPELDDSPLLDPDGHRVYQQLIGMAQWLVTIGRFDLAFALNSLSRFSSSPRERQLGHAIRIFKYLKKHPVKWVRLDPGDHTAGGELSDPLKGMKPEWHNYYHQATELIDAKHPIPSSKSGFKPLETTVYFDSNFAHDEVTRRSVTGTITYVGNCPVAWLSKRQGAIATGTYGAELCAAKQGTEDAIAIRCILRSFGVPLKGRTKLLGDNLGSLISATTPGSPCKKKHSSIAYHFVRECNAAGIVEVLKVHTDYNLSDPFTKALAKNKFWGSMGTLYARRVRIQKGFSKRQRRGQSDRSVRPKGRTTACSTMVRV